MSNRKTYLIEQEAKHVQNSIGAMPNSSSRCVTAVAKAILLHGKYFYDGKLINPVAKSVGAGVWEVTHKEDNP